MHHKLITLYTGFALGNLGPTNSTLTNCKKGNISYKARQDKHIIYSLYVLEVSQCAVTKCVFRASQHAFYKVYILIVDNKLVQTRQNYIHIHTYIHIYINYITYICFPNVFCCSILVNVTIDQTEYAVNDVLIRQYILYICWLCNLHLSFCNYSCFCCPLLADLTMNQTELAVRTASKIA